VRVRLSVVHPISYAAVGMLMRDVREVRAGASAHG
jgi:hypothetical protein